MSQDNEFYSHFGVVAEDTTGTPLAQGRHSPAQLAQGKGLPVPEIDKFVEEGGDKVKKRSFVFTINNPKLDPQEFVELIRNMKATALLFQHEVGENGTPHYQGWLRFKNARLFGGLCTELGGWVRPCKSDIAARKYCSKKRTRIADPFGFGCDEAKEDVTTISEENFYPWQRDLVEELRGEAHPREIIWRWSVAGNVGKSSFCKWLVKHMGAMVFSGKAADIKAALADLDEAGKPMPPVLVWDIPRSQETYVSWQALEEVKNGLFFSGKFHGRQVMFNTRHVLVFANFEPDESRLSSDRWSNIVRLDV